MSNHSIATTTVKKGIFSKYRSLILLIFAFLVLIIVLSVMALYSSNQFEETTKELDAASNQTVLAQQLSKDLIDLNLYLEAQIDGMKAENTNILGVVPPTQVTNVVAVDDLPQTAIYQLEDISKQAEDFTRNLEAFKNGGSIVATNGETITLSAANTEGLRKTIENIEAIWQPYLGLLDNFTQERQKGTLNKQTSDYLVDYTRLYNTALQTETQEYVAQLNGIASGQANFLRMVQEVGVVIAFLLFLGIVFGSLRQLARSDERLEAAREQTAEILATVNEGLFLIDKNLTIANEYSNELEDIIQQNELGGKNLTEVLEKLVPAKDLDDTKTFIEQLYSDWVVEDLIDDLNPLKRLKTQVPSKQGGFNERYLDFSFSRVYKQEDVVRVLVSVMDITQEVQLEKRLENEKAQNDRQMEMLSTIVNTDSSLLDNFISTTLTRINKVNSILKTPGSELEYLQEKAKEVYREIHSLKGESSALKLTQFVGLCQEIEGKLKQLNDKANLSGSDFLGMAVNLEELLNLTLFIQSLSKRIGFTNKDATPLPSLNSTQGYDASQVHKPHHAPMHHEKHDEDEFLIGEQNKSKPNLIDALPDYFKNFADDIAQRHDKKVVFNNLDIQNLGLTHEQQNAIKDIAIQLIRNAIVHGIELPEDRVSRGKSAEGKISLSLTRQEDGQAGLIVIDDGQGINYDKIRQKALAKGHSIDEVQNWSHQELLNLLFQSGFSTAESLSEDAGRGVGLDIIKSLTDDLQGVLKVASKPNQYTKFSIIFPINQ